MIHEKKTMVAKSVSSQHFTFGDTNAGDGILDSVLVDCTLRIVDARAFSMSGSRFTRCHFEMVKEAETFKCFACELNECTFAGRFYGCSFGLPAMALSPSAVQPLLNKCDFSKCEMHLCGFVNGDPDTLTFPGWPHFTVIFPFRHVDDWMSIPFPNSFLSIQRTVAVWGGEATIASIDNWHRYAKECGEAMEPSAELRQILESKSYIRM